VAVAVLLACLGAFLASRNALVNSVDDALVAAANRASQQQGLDPQSLPGVSVQLVVPGGTVVVDGGLPVGPGVLAVANGKATAYFTNITVSGTQLREYVSYLPNASVSGQPLFTGSALQVATPLTGVNEQLGHLGLALTLVALGGVVLAVILGWLVGRTVLAPLYDLTRSVERVADTTDVTERLDPGGVDEMGRLRRAFNRLLAALEASRESQRQLVLDAAHELRTPMTSLRTNLEVIRRLDELPPEDRDVLVDDVLTQLGELTTLVGDLAELARGEQHAQEAETYRLDQLVEDAVAVATTHGRSRHVRIEATLSATWVHGHPERVMRAVGNLIDNALKWSPEGGRVEVSCHGGEVTVRDHGPGIDPADLPHVFDRFYRAPAARRLPGSGLGLAIVAQVAHEEGGSVWAGEAPGGGAVLRLQLPPVSGPAELPAAPPALASGGADGSTNGGATPAEDAEPAVPTEAETTGPGA
jgi:two-component system sensor histidine kinase MprB